MDFFNTHVGPQARWNVEHVLDTCRLSEGTMVRAFEEKLSTQLGLANPVTVNSGTSAIHLGLILAGVKSGDEVILPAQTFVATGMAVLMCGATPVFADIDPMTGNIDLEDVLKRISSKTAAIVMVHWAGLPCDLDYLSVVNAVWDDIGFVEDAAHALGSTYMGFPIGNSPMSDYVAFSLQSTKTCTSGDGGVLCHQHERNTLRAKRLRWFGIDRSLLTGVLGEREFDIDECGFKYHMNDVAASIGLGNLEGFEARLKRRQEIGARYRRELVDVPGATLTDLPSDRTHAYYCFPLLVDYREKFCKAMKSKDIPVSVVASRIDKYKVFGGRRYDLPGTDYFDSHQINLPCHEALQDEDVSRVIEVVKGGW